MTSKSPQEKRGGSSSTHKHGTVKTTANMPKEVRPGEEKAIARSNKVYVKRQNS